MIIKHCPECKSANIKFSSRRRYFFKSAGCLLIVVLFCLIIYGLKDEDPDRVVLLGVCLSMVLICLFLSMSIYYLIKGILTKETGYRCKFCNNSFQNPILSDKSTTLLLKEIARRGDG
ncbi:hypothetical protein [Mucilaginibacter flavidus]|uniref:hypothetical protein n=1 Tax=Mucilaginibacter flavidus TaxID=2949309 RepID=UPI0020923639|nr:hypothetical protein [Mucilaginibacter flavidus]MCO5948373.1 hypothetical protein [Mucilaginibacter flavidus]